MKNKKADTQVVVHDLIANRWSPRAFEVNKWVSQEALVSVLEAARWAPSCFNAQPWRFIVFDKSKDELAWKKAFKLLAEKNQLWAKNAPVLILVIAADNFSHNGDANRWAQYDVGAATLNLVLQAQVSGLMAHQMGGFDVEAACSAFEIPTGYTLMSMVALGYQADGAILADDFKEMENAERERIALGAVSFRGKWNVEFT